MKFVKSQDTNTLKTHENQIKTRRFSKQVESDAGLRIQNIEKEPKFIRLKNVRAVWQHQLQQSYKNGIFDVSTEIGSGLSAIIGSIGSGKSTLLNAILGELHIDDGMITVNGSLSYAAQEPWLFDSSIRDNIVFVEHFDELRYNRVIKVCALEHDLQLLPQGDATIVGEKGISLSGGQRARINLARAVYKQSDIYLLDDPLSAVDAHVGKHIFEQCIQEFLGDDKVCVLITHQIQYLKNVDHVILMKNGRIEAEGPFNSLQKLTNKLLDGVEKSSNSNEMDSGKNSVCK